MSEENRSIDFCKEKAIYENMTRVKRQRKANLIDSNKKKNIGVTMLCDRGNNLTYGVKAQYANESRGDNPVVEVITNYADTHTKFEVRILEIMPKEATLLEMFALCSYADHHMNKGSMVFGAFRELKNYVNVAGDQQVCHKEETFYDFVYCRSNWVETVNTMKEEFLQAGLYYQYQSCLHILDIFDFLYELQDKLLEELPESDEEENAFSKLEEYDATAEIVIEMMKKEWDKYKI